MLSKNKIKYLCSLSEKKGRFENMTFLVEGEKMVLEVLSSGFHVKAIYVSNKMKAILSGTISNIEIIEISEMESSRISTQKTPQGIFAEVTIPKDFYTEQLDPVKDLTIALNDIQDPGNLGTIIRTADWFGIKKIICSKSTVDILNPKVLQSTMGAAFRVKLVYTDLPKAIKELKQKQPDLHVFATTLDGDNLYKKEVPASGIVMMGNESKGLSEELIQLATHKITVPRFGNSIRSSESLNVSVATAIVLSELRRKSIRTE